ncbi:phosphatidylinositol 4-phosphate 3-kinase C2 domain-containing subunit gamma-like [Fukomys damarensis]|uniref:phosphatidylinositol 4-phosphate 3-kinase C2 domain-containing subunit gamma-like n=1 Tax=Fukomys damarensis TaxID=885580 RepID=UPI0008FEB109|nr:phosphatidylinositol 4-phosphate 3-kinase C2 domain-containing subunit gamma-like [Fukomys damarensis]
MAYSWQSDPNPKQPHEEQYEHRDFHSVNQSRSSQVSLGFDQLVNEISNKIPLHQSNTEENTFYVPSELNWDSKRHSLAGTHQISVNEFPSKRPEVSWNQCGKTAAIGFNLSVGPKPKVINKQSSWENSVRKYQGSDGARFSTVHPSCTDADEINSQRELRNENHNYSIGFENISHVYSSFSIDFMPKDENKSKNINTVDPSPVLFKNSFLPRTWESTWAGNIEPRGCSIQIAEVLQGSNMTLASFCDKVKKIKETYRAADINSNSGKIWSPVTAFPFQLFADSKFNLSIFTHNSGQLLHLTPHADYLVKDLIAEILHLCTSDHLCPKDHLLGVCGSEEFLQIDHCLGSHKMFQKNKSVQLHLQKNRTAPGKLSRKPVDDHGELHLNQLLEFTHIWKVSRQCLSTAIKKYDFHLKYLLTIQRRRVLKKDEEWG